MKKPLLIALTIFFAAMMLLSGFMVWRHLAAGWQTDERFESLAGQIAPPPAAPSTPEGGEAQPAAPEWTVQDQYGVLFEQYPDMVGWISIDGTALDYPVMQTPDRPDYYLRRGLGGQPSDYGVPYAAEACSIDPPSGNITLYGHHMKDGRMFGALENYKDKAFYLEHPHIRFDTRAGFGTYEIVAVFAVNPDEFAYHTFTGDGGEAAFDDYLRQCAALSYYDTGVSARYGDKLITLSTCEYSQDNGRLAVVARRITE